MYDTYDIKVVALYDTYDMTQKGNRRGHAYVLLYLQETYAS